MYTNVNFPEVISSNEPFTKTPTVQYNYCNTEFLRRRITGLHYRKLVKEFFCVLRGERRNDEDKEMNYSLYMINMKAEGLYFAISGELFMHPRCVSR